MSRPLSELTLRELWELFPIFLVAPKAQWKADYAEAEAELVSGLHNFNIARISHVGSTAIKGIWAKDIVDIMLELEPGEDMEAAAAALGTLGYTRMSEEPGRIFFNRGYTPEGFAEKVFHLHVRFRGDNHELYFRDYMNEHPEEAKAYEALKLRLWKEYEHNRDGYTEAKGQFISRCTQKAKVLYPDRYC